ncbi:MAG: RNA-binding protein [Bauldia sp.]|nr:RNA-binding protein [Bauldia sp.]MCW5717948.1 RNA-binding protein [Bauldia sp.]
MPKGPRGEKRDADVIKNAVRVMKIATGEEADTATANPGQAKGGRKGAASRAAKLSPEERKAIAAKAAAARWGK